MRELRFNVGGDPGDDVPLLQPDQPPGAPAIACSFEGPGRLLAVIPDTSTGGAWLTYQHGQKRFRVILPPLDAEFQREAGEPPQLPPEYDGDADRVALHYDDTPPAAAARRGVVRLVGKAWVDDGGPFYPLDTSLLWGLGGWMKGGAERARVKRNLAFVQAHGYDGVRILYHVDWTQQPYGGLIAGNPSALGEFLDCAYDEFGLRTKITAQAGALDVIAIGREIVHAVQPRREKVLMLEGTNEQWATPADGVRLAETLMTAGVPTSVGFGTLRGENGGLDPLLLLGELAGTNVDTVHLERTPPATRRDRQCWDFHVLKKAGDNGEFAGPGSSVASEEDPFHLATQRAGSIVCGGEKYCLHTGSMVYGVAYNGPTGPRYANLEEIPNIDAMMRAVRNVDKAIGHTGVGNWLHTNNPIPMEVVSGRVEKQYFAISGKDFVAILTDTSGALAFRENRPIAAFATFDPSTGDQVDYRSANLRAYILKGQLA